MNNQGIRIFKALRRTMCVIYEVQIVLINGEFLKASYSWGMNESCEASSDDPAFKKVLDSALFQLSCEPQVYKDMWEALSKEGRKLAESLSYNERGYDWFMGVKSGMGDEDINKKLQQFELTTEGKEFKEFFDSFYLKMDTKPSLVNESKAEKIDKEQEKKINQAEEEIIKLLKGKSLY